MDFFLGNLALGLILIGGIGSALGVRAIGVASAAAWAKEGKEGKTLTGKYVAFVGMPVSQTLYCLIIFNQMAGFTKTPGNGAILLGIAIGVGLAELFSAYAQGEIGAAGVRCLSENGGQGTGVIVVAMGIAESIGLFALVVGIMILSSPAMYQAAAVATGM